MFDTNTKNYFVRIFAVASLAIASIYSGGLVGCGSTNLPTLDGSTPTVTATSPAEGDTDVFLNRKIAVAFSEEMAPASGTTFTLLQGTTAVSGSVASSGIDAVFTPTSNLAASTLYTATITTEAKDLSGNALASNYVWSFTTGTTTDTSTPTVSSTNPDNAAIGVSINRKIAATFSEEMNALTITSSTFLLTGPGTTPVTGTVGYALGGNVAIFTPSSNLAANTLFTATLTTGTQDLSGNALASNYVWTFTTGSTADDTAPTVTLTNPADTDTGVAINRTVTATFSEAMDALTITTANYTVTGPGTTAVVGTVDYDLVNRIATFTPSSNLAASTTFTATLTTGAQDLAGNALAANNVWSFTTGTTTAAGPAPVVLGTAGNFVILSKSGISTVPPSVVTGDIGVSPIDQTAITGFSETADASNTFSTSTQVIGKIYAADYAPPTPTNMTTAISDMETAYSDAAARTLPDATELGAGNISGLTIVPGLYKWGTGVTMNNTGVTLSGGANDVWIFQIGQTLTVSEGAIVTLSGGAQANNIFWQVAGQTTLGTTSNFKGIILDQTAIVLNTDAAMTGRALAQTAVTLDHSTVTQP